MSRDKQRGGSIANEMCAVELAIEPRGQESFRVTLSDESASNHLIKMIEPRSNSIGNENVKEPEPSTKIQTALNGSIPFELLNNKTSDGRSIVIELKSDYQKNFLEIMALGQAWPI